MLISLLFEFSYRKYTYTVPCVVLYFDFRFVPICSFPHLCIDLLHVTLTDHYTSPWKSSTKHKYQYTSKIPPSWPLAISRYSNRTILGYRIRIYCPKLRSSAIYSALNAIQNSQLTGACKFVFSQDEILNLPVEPTRWVRYVYWQ